MLEVIEPDCSNNRVGHSAVGLETLVERSEVAVHANADEHEGIFNELGVCLLQESCGALGSVDGVRDCGWAC